MPKMLGAGAVLRGINRVQQSRMEAEIPFRYFPLRLSAAWEINNLKLSIAKITGNPS